MTATPPLLHYLALGDSYTIGEAVAADQCWPAVLWQHLRTAGIVIDDPQIVAATGWTTDELAHDMDASTLTPPYDLVTLQIGVNNQYRGRSADDYREQFGHLLARAIALTGDRAAHVLVVSIPDWGVTRFARTQRRNADEIARELDVYNATARTVVAQAGARWVDITTVSRQRPDMLADDGLHPSAAQYVLWVDLIAPVAQAALIRHD